MIWSLLVACAPPLAPSQDLSADEARLSTLPPDVTVVASVDAAALRDVPAVRRERLDEILSAAGATSDDVDRVVLGCGEDGCAALAEGRFAPEVGLDVGTSLGRVAVRRLDGSRMAVGDRSALRRIAADATSGAEGLDPAALEGRIPAGDAWLLLRHPEVLSEQAAARLERAPLWQDVAGDLREAWATHGARAEGISSVAVSLDAGERVIRARAVCDSDAVARRLHLEIEAWKALHAGSEGEIVREGAVLEWTRDASALWGAP
jgi:hypothetical protein